MPKHPADRLLRAYTKGSSFPPKAQDEYDALADKAYARAESPTASHDLRKLLELGEQRAAAEITDKLAAAEATIAHAADRRERFIDAIVTGVIVIVVGAALLGLYGLSHLLRGP